jgi:Na+/melibiose symporter-like transporter
MEDDGEDGASSRKLSVLFYSASGAVLDALILYFVFALSGGPHNPEGVLMTMLSIGLLFPCVAGILVGIWWEKKNIFVCSFIVYGSFILAGSIYYMSQLSSIDIWGPLFAIIGLVIVYYAGNHIRQSI